MTGLKPKDDVATMTHFTRAHGPAEVRGSGRSGGGRRAGPARPGSLVAASLRAPFFSRGCGGRSGKLRGGASSRSEPHSSGRFGAGLKQDAPKSREGAVPGGGSPPAECPPRPVPLLSLQMFAREVPRVWIWLPTGPRQAVNGLTREGRSRAGEARASALFHQRVASDSLISSVLKTVSGTKNLTTRSRFLIVLMLFDTVMWRSE